MHGYYRGHAQVLGRRGAGWAEVLWLAHVQIPVAVPQQVLCADLAGPHLLLLAEAGVAHQVAAAAR